MSTVPPLQGLLENPRYGELPPDLKIEAIRAWEKDEIERRNTSGDWDLNSRANFEVETRRARQAALGIEPQSPEEILRGVIEDENDPEAAQVWDALDEVQAAEREQREINRRRIFPWKREDDDAAKLEAIEGRIVAAKSGVAENEIEQARLGAEALQGKRDAAVVRGKLVLNPELYYDRERYVAAVNSSSATPREKARALAGFYRGREETAKAALPKLRGVGAFRSFADTYAAENPEATNGDVVEAFRKSGAGEAKIWENEILSGYAGGLLRTTATVPYLLGTLGKKLGMEEAGNAAQDSAISLFKEAADLDKVYGEQTESLGGANYWQQMARTGGQLFGDVMLMGLTGGTTTAVKTLFGGSVKKMVAAEIGKKLGVGGLAKKWSKEAAQTLFSPVGAVTFASGAGSKIYDSYERNREKLAAEGLTGPELEEQARGNAAIDGIRTGAITATITSLFGLKGSEGIARLTQVAGNPGVREAIKKGSMERLQSFATGVGGEALEEALDEGINGGLDALLENPDMTFEDWEKATLFAGSAGALFGGGIEGVTQIAEAAAERVKNSPEIRARQETVQSLRASGLNQTADALEQANVVAESDAVAAAIDEVEARAVGAVERLDAIDSELVELAKTPGTETRMAELEAERDSLNEALMIGRDAMRNYDPVKTANIAVADVVAEGVEPGEARRRVTEVMNARYTNKPVTPQILAAQALAAPAATDTQPTNEEGILQQTEADAQTEAQASEVLTPAEPVSPVTPVKAEPTFRAIAGRSAMVDNEAGDIRIDEDGTVLLDRGPSAPPIIVSRNPDAVLSTSEFNVTLDEETEADLEQARVLRTTIGGRPTPRPIERPAPASTFVRDDGSIVTSFSGERGPVAAVTDFVSEGETEAGDLFVTVKDRETGNEFELHGDDALAVAVARRDTTRDVELSDEISELLADSPKDPEVSQEMQIEFDRVLVRLVKNKPNLLRVTTRDSATAREITTEQVDAAFDELTELNDAIENENFPINVKVRLGIVVDDAFNDIANVRARVRQRPETPADRGTPAPATPLTGGTEETVDSAPSESPATSVTNEPEAAPETPAPVVDAVTTTDTGAQYVTGKTKNGGTSKTWTRTKGGRSVGDTYDPGMVELVVINEDISSDATPDEYRITEISRIVNGDKNEIETTTRDMTQEEMAATKAKLEKANEMRRENGMAELPVPETPAPVVDAVTQTPATEAEISSTPEPFAPPTSTVKTLQGALTDAAPLIERLNDLGVRVVVVKNEKEASTLIEGRPIRKSTRGFTSVVDGVPTIVIIESRTKGSTRASLGKFIRHEAVHGAHLSMRRSDSTQNDAALAALLDADPTLASKMDNLYPGYAQLSPQGKLSEIVVKIAEGRLKNNDVPQNLREVIQRLIDYLLGEVAPISPEIRALADAVVKELGLTTGSATPTPLADDVVETAMAATEGNEEARAELMAALTPEQRARFETVVPDNIEGRAVTVSSDGRWRVQTEENRQRAEQGLRQIGGDRIFDTREEAEIETRKEIEIDRQDAESRARREAETSAREAAARAKAAPLKGYLDDAGFKGVSRARVESTLSAPKNLRNSETGKVYNDTRFNVIQEVIADGGRVEAKSGKKTEFRLYSDRDTFWDINKTEYDAGLWIMSKNEPTDDFPVDEIPLDASPTGPLTEEVVFNKILATAKREIMADIASGEVSADVTSFGDLNDYVDANGYVNDFNREDRMVGPLGKSLGWGTQGYIDFTNRVIESLDQWLASGRPALDASPSAQVEIGFYSRLQRVIADKVPNSATPQQILATIDPARGTGVKEEEIKWSGLRVALDRLAAENSGKVPKQALLDYLAADGAVKFEEVAFGGNEAEKKALAEANTELLDLRGELLDGPLNFQQFQQLSREAEFGGSDYRDTQMREFPDYSEQISRYHYLVGQTFALRNGGVTLLGFEPRYAQYQLPGGENYREVVLAMPVTRQAEPASVIAERIKKRTGVSDRDLADYLNSDASDLIQADKEFQAWINAKLDDRAKAAGNQGTRSVSDYTSSHFPNVPNYVAHMRLNERSDASGRPGLFLEELQSDRHQAGREHGYIGDRAAFPEFPKTLPSDLVLREYAGYYEVQSPNGFEAVIPGAAGPTREAAVENYYREKARLENPGMYEARDGGVPDAPFRKDWPLQLFKRALRDAAATGKEWIGWTTGETQADRYDLSKQVSKIKYDSYPEGVYDVWVYGIDRSDDEPFAYKSRATPAELAEFIGKEMTDRIVSGAGRLDENQDYMEITGDGLKVGGEGMKGFYDNILPKEIAKYVKQWGAVVEKSEAVTEPARPDGLVRMPGDTRPTGRAATTAPIWRVTITPEMQESIANEGQPLFANPQTATSFTEDSEWQEVTNVLLDRAIAKYPKIPVTKDPNIPAPARTMGLRILVNPTELARYTEGMEVADAAEMIDKLFIHEATHRHAVAEVGDNTVVEYANTMTADERTDVAFAYLHRSAYPSDEAYLQAVNDFAAVDPNLSPGDRRVRLYRLGHEALRMSVERLTSGYTTEETLAFLQTNPGNLQRFLRYLGAYLRRLKQWFAARKDPAIGVEVRRLAKVIDTLTKGETVSRGPVNFDPSAQRRPVRFQGRPVMIEAPAVGLEAPAYHGTPHKWAPETLWRLTDGRTEWIVDGDPVPAGSKMVRKAPAGRVRADKVGTGEGAAAYGWGVLYAAEDEGVAKYYKETLTEESGKTATYLGEPASSWRVARGMKEASEVTMILDLMDQQKWSAKQAFNYLRDAGEDLEYDLAENDFSAAVESKEGALLSLDLKVDQDLLLDWDKPLSEQSEKVREALSRIGITEAMNKWRGEALYGHVKVELTYGGEQRGASMKLLENGIQGIRYLDGATRLPVNFQEKLAELRTEVAQLKETIAKNEGRPWDLRKQFEDWLAASERDLAGMERDAKIPPSYNYVIFDPDLIEVTGVNGEPVSTEVRDEALGLDAAPVGVWNKPKAGQYVPGGGLTAAHRWDRRVYKMLEAARGEYSGYMKKAEFAVKQIARLMKDLNVSEMAVNAALGNTENRLTQADVDQIKAIKKRGLAAAQGVYLSARNKAKALDAAGMFADAALARQDAKAQFDLDVQTYQRAAANYEARARRAAAAKAYADRQAAMAALPKPLADEVANLRTEIDLLSDRMIAEGDLSAELKATISANKELWLHRSYQIFDDPNYVAWINEQKDPEAIRLRNKTINYLRQDLITRKVGELMASGMNRTAATAQAQIDVTDAHVADAFDDYLMVADNGSKTLLTGATVSKEVSALMKRGVIPEEIQELWGRYDDPAVNAAKSIGAIAQHLAVHKFYQDTVALGTKEGWLVKDGPGVLKRDAQGNRLVPLLPNNGMAGRYGNKPKSQYAPLAGYLGPEALRDALAQMVDDRAGHRFIQSFTQLTGYSMASKTVLSWQSGMRNFWGNVLPTMINGNVTYNLFDPRYKRARVGAFAQLFARGSAQTRAYVERATALGVLGDSITDNLIRDLTGGFDSDKKVVGLLGKVTRAKFFGPLIDKTRKAALKTYDVSGKAYNMPDEFWKIVNFEGEKARLREILPNETEEQIEVRAAEIVRNTMPTYSRAPEWVKVLRKFPVMAPFITFPAEMVRITLGQGKVGLDFIREGKATGNKKMEAAGYHRLLASGIVAGVVGSIPAIFKVLSDVSTDDEDDLRKHLAPWEKNVTLLFLGRDEEDPAKINYLNLSFMNPYDIWLRPWRSFMRGMRDPNADGFGVTAEAASELVDPIAKEQILFGAILDTRRGVTATGTPIWDESDSLRKRAEKSLAHIYKSALEPGTIASVKNIARAANEEVRGSGKAYDFWQESISAGLGLKANTVDVKTSLGYATQDYHAGRRNSASTFSRVIKSRGTQKDEDIINAYVEANDKMLRTYRELYEKTVGAVRLGAMTRQEAVKILRAEDVPADVIGDILNNRYRRITLTPESLRDIRQQSEKLGQDRINLYRQALDRVPAVQQISEDTFF